MKPESSKVCSRPCLLESLLLSVDERASQAE